MKSIVSSHSKEPPGLHFKKQSMGLAELNERQNRFANQAGLPPQIIIEEISK